jgi:hypothetical protein
MSHGDRELKGWPRTDPPITPQCQASCTFSVSGRFSKPVSRRDSGNTEIEQTLQAWVALFPLCTPRPLCEPNHPLIDRGTANASNRATP